MRHLTIVISALVIAVGIFSGLYYLDNLSNLPTEEELPNEILIRNTEGLEEVKLFLEKYPDAHIKVDRSGQLAVDYRISQPPKENNSSVAPYIRLRVFLNSNGDPDGMFVDCWDGQRNNMERDNIVSYLKTETCLGGGA
jgi:hypothetical protein